MIEGIVLNEAYLACLCRYHGAQIDIAICCKRRQERQNGAHAALGDGKNAKLILLGRDGDSATGKFWMLKSDGVGIVSVNECFMLSGSLQQYVCFCTEQYISRRSARKLPRS